MDFEPRDDFRHLPPGIFIILLGAIWYFSGSPLEVDFSLQSLIPKMDNLPQLVLFAGVLISLAGMEMSAVHARDVEHPRKDYPKAILYSALIILGLSIPGVLSIAMVVPQSEISLMAGSLQAIDLFMQKYSLSILVPLMAFFITIGSIASVSTWTVGPIKSLLAAAQVGDLPPTFRRLNKSAMPIPLMILQAVVVSLISLLFVFFPTLNEAFWFLVAMVTELYLVMYLLMFAAAVKLRYKRPDVERPYKIPGGNFGMWLVSGIGILSSLFTIFIGILPPGHFKIASATGYVAAMVIGVVLFCLGPSIILLFKKKEWEKPLKHETS
jgi:glutamate:GABA antiporter